MTKQQFFQMVNRPLTMRFYLLWKLPMAWFAGIGVRSLEEHKAVVKLPYGWRSQNPFRSTYFAAQCAAGELSTGLLALAQLQETPPVSMLVTNIEAEFFKKASEMLLFTCEDGEALRDTVQKALQSDEAHTFTATSTGRLPDGTIASVVRITWSFKLKQRARSRTT